MPTGNVVSSDQQHELVEELVRSGRYQNASEVLRDGLRLVEQHTQEGHLNVLAPVAGALAGRAVGGRRDGVQDSSRSRRPRRAACG